MKEKIEIDKFGIIKLKKNRYRKIYKIQDVNFEQVSNEEKCYIYQDYLNMIEILDSDTEVQFVISKEKIDEEKILKEISYPIRADGYNKIRKSKNDMLQIKQKEISRFRRELYIILTINYTSTDEVMQKFNELETKLDCTIMRINGAGYQTMTKNEIVSKISENHNIESQDGCYYLVRKDKTYLKQGKFQENCFLKNSLVLDRNVLMEAIRHSYSEMKITISYRRLNRAAQVKLRKNSKKFLNSLDDFYSTEINLSIESDSKAELEKTKLILMSTLNGYLHSGMLYKNTKGNWLIRKLQNRHKEYITSRQLAEFIPFSYCNQMNLDGVLYGVNKQTCNWLFYNRKKVTNPNGILLGSPGSGNIEIIKNEIENVLLRTDDFVYLIDNESDYTELIEKYSGKRITIGSTEKNNINPLDLYVEPFFFSDHFKQRFDPLSMKIDFITTLLSAKLLRDLSTLERSILDRCVRKLYQPYLEHMQTLQKSQPEISVDIEASPLMLDLYHILSCQPEKEAQILNIAVLNLSKYSYRTNADKADRLVVFQPEISTRYDTCSMLIGLEYIWNQMLLTQKINKYKWLYVSNAESSLNSFGWNYLGIIYKLGRTRGCIPTCIIRNPDIILEAPVKMSLLNNCDTILILNQSEEICEKLKELLYINPKMIEYLRNSEAYQGLLFTYRDTIPFDLKPLLDKHNIKKGDN